jgi:hypothetical protein
MGSNSTRQPFSESKRLTRRVTAECYVGLCRTYDTRHGPRLVLKDIRSSEPSANGGRGEFLQRRSGFFERPVLCRPIALNKGQRAPRYQSHREGTAGRRPRGGDKSKQQSSQLHQRAELLRMMGPYWEWFRPRSSPPNTRPKERQPGASQAGPMPASANLVPSVE